MQVDGWTGEWAAGQVGDAWRADKIQ